MGDRGPKRLSTRPDVGRGSTCGKGGKQKLEEDVSEA
jgi:hypothetical protein